MAFSKDSSPESCLVGSKRLQKQLLGGHKLMYRPLQTFAALQKLYGPGLSQGRDSERLRNPMPLRTPARC